MSGKKYLKFADEIVAVVNTDTGEVKVINNELLPWSLSFREGNDFKTAYGNLNSFKEWCAGRTLSLSKANAKRICNAIGLLQTEATEYKANLAMSYKCLSLDDAYWVTTENDSSTWRGVCLHLNKFENVLTPISLRGEVSTPFKGRLSNSSDISVNGTFAKSWVRSEVGLVLHKADEDNTSNETVNEVLASEVLCYLGVTHVEYTLGSNHDVRVSMCRCFTDENYSFIPFKDVITKYGKRAKALEWIKQAFPVDYANLVVATYLIGNEDLHDGNWGVLLDNNKKIVISLAPMFDFNYAFTDRGYYKSGGMMFIPESYYVDAVTGEQIADSIKDDYNYRIICNETLESAALREVNKCTLNLEEFDYWSETGRKVSEVHDYPLQVKLQELNRRLELLRQYKDIREVRTEDIPRLLKF